MSAGSGSDSEDEYKPLVCDGYKFPLLLNEL